MVKIKEKYQKQQNAYCTVTKSWPVDEPLFAVIVAVPRVGPNVAVLCEVLGKFKIEVSLEVHVEELVTSEPLKLAVNT